MKHAYHRSTPEPRAAPLYAKCQGSARADVRTNGCRLSARDRLALAAAAVLLTFPVNVSRGQEPAGFEQLNAHEAVRRGNQLLIDGDAPMALEAYEHAKGLMPDALEIPFVQGLGHYALKEYEPAREAFEKVALSKNRKLANDATYSVGTTFHAEALESAAEPQLAIEKLEIALQRYQSVLANESDHTEARDAIVKAASMRRQLKRMLEQQQQQDQDQDQQNNEGEDSEDQQQQKRDGEQDEQQQSESQQQQPSDESQDRQDQQQSAQEDEQEEDQEQRQMQESEAQQQEQTSQEQAQRRLREMMQNIRERQKRRREQPQPFRVAPVDKDW